MDEVPATPADSPLTMNDVVSSPSYRDLSTPKLAIGDIAFDFTLPLLDLQEQGTGETVTLSSYREKRPVALIFGSYT
jgi:hypothetical protein